MGSIYSLAISLYKLDQFRLLFAGSFGLTVKMAGKGNYELVVLNTLNTIDTLVPKWLNTREFAVVPGYPKDQTKRRTIVFFIPVR